MIAATSGILRAAIVCWLAAFFATPAPSAANAQNFPSRPIRLIVPFAPGGLNDSVSRLLQPHLERALRVPIVIDNRPAASGIVGTEAVAKAPPDGHTLLMVASSHTVVPATNPKLPYDADKSFAPIAMVGKNPFLFIVNAKVPAKTIGDFVALAKANPGKIDYATVGAASQSHFVAELFSQRAGIKRPIAAARQLLRQRSPARRSSPSSRLRHRCRTLGPARCGRLRRAASPAIRSSRI